MISSNDWISTWHRPGIIVICIPNSRVRARITRNFNSTLYHTTLNSYTYDCPTIDLNYSAIQSIFLKSCSFLTT